MKNTTLYFALTLSLVGGALAAPQVGRKETTTTKADVNPPVSKLLTPKEKVEHFWDNLPKMRMDKPIDNPKPKGGDTDRKGDYITTTYTLASTPKELVSMGEVSALWLGAMLSERGVRKGGNDVTEIPIPGAMRAPLELTFSSLGGGSKIVNYPTKGDVKNTINSLLTGAVKQKKAWGDPNNLSEAYSFEVVENQNETQTALKLGINVRYMSTEVKSGLSMEKSSGQHTVTAAFIERAFTLTARPGAKDKYKLADRWVTPTFTMDVANNLKDNGFIGDDNVPCYVSGITYGRRLIFSMSSRFSASQIKFALQAAYKGVAVKAKLDVEAEKVLKDSETTIKVAGQGGPSPDKLKNLLLKGDLGAYFATAPTPGQLVPISYEIRSVTDDAPVIVLQTDKYTETQYIGNATGRRYQITAYAKLTSRPEVTNANGEIYG
ncbi:thiol-activated cytolysin family protein, partial [Armatimonas sp.]|uniref:thiol-activated cytolysin family protein n=1 Tax=Armatimonas sp. TaxID=1872638 RepID=UPI003751BFDC